MQNIGKIQAQFGYHDNHRSKTNLSIRHGRKLLYSVIGKINLSLII